LSLNKRGIKIVKVKKVYRRKKMLSLKVLKKKRKRRFY